MKKYTITKLDRRHTGYSQFTHYINPVWTSSLADKIEFFEWRKWCWETFGPGMERDNASLFGSRQFEACRWAWHTEKSARRLYFASEKELNWFNMKWISE